VTTDGLKNDINWAQTQWAALRAAHQLASEKPFSFVLVDLVRNAWDRIIPELQAWHLFGEEQKRVLVCPS